MKRRKSVKVCYRKLEVHLDERNAGGELRGEGGAIAFHCLVLFNLFKIQSFNKT